MALLGNRPKLKEDKLDDWAVKGLKVVLAVLIANVIMIPLTLVGGGIIFVASALSGAAGTVTSLILGLTLFILQFPVIGYVVEWLYDW